MNDLHFDDTESEAVNSYRHPQPPTVAPWFAYITGTIIAIAAFVFIVETIRVELLIRDAKEGSERVIENIKERQKARSSQPAP